MDFRIELKWQRLKAKEKSKHTLCCPYCNVKVQAESDTRIYDINSGAIKYHIFKCPECYMPIIISPTGEIIPQSQFLPFTDINFLPENIGKMYCECRKCFANECYHSVLILSRTIIMHIAIKFGAEPNKKFVYYVSYLHNEGHIAQKARETWVDKIRRLGNDYVHELDEATTEDAELVLKSIMYLLINVFELPATAGGIR